MIDENLPQPDDDSRRARLWRAANLFTCTATTFLYAMTVTIANVSLPQMQGSLSATQDQIAWVVTLNIVATAIATPMAGWLVSRFGQRRLMLGCVLGFAVSSLACGLAQSLDSLVVYRIAQGAFGAPLVPVSQALLLAIYPQRQHGAVVAIFGMGSTIGPIVGPVLGGYLSEALSWRWVFFMVLPFTVVSFVGVLMVIRDIERPLRVRLDWAGLVTLSIAVACLQLMLDRGERADWFQSTEIVTYAVLGAAGLYLFVSHSLTTPRPFLDPRLLRDRNFTIGLLMIVVFGMLNFTPMTLLPPLLQNVRGYPDSIIGFILSARGSGTLLGFFMMIYLGRVDPRILITIGFATQALAGWSLSTMDVNLTTGDVLWAIFAQGFGVGILWPPITVVAFSTLPRMQMPEGTAVYHLLRNIGSSVHISLSIAIVLRMSRTSYAELAPSVSAFDELLAMPWVTGAFNLESQAGLAALSGEMARQSAMLGYISSFHFFTWTALAVLPLVFLVRLRR